jgi:hypothetical protein
MAATMKTAIFWVVALHRLLWVYQRFRGHPDDGGSTVLWNTGKLIPVYMALQPRRKPYSFLWVINCIRYIKLPGKIQHVYNHTNVDSVRSTHWSQIKSWVQWMVSYNILNCWFLVIYVHLAEVTVPEPHNELLLIPCLMITNHGQLILLKYYYSNLFN